MTRSGKQFYITFIDDYSRYTTIYLQRNKDEARDAFIKYKNEVENQLSKKKLKGLELIGEESMSPHYSPEPNGVAERKNKTLKK